MQTPIQGISSMATRAILAELSSSYESTEKQPVSIAAMGGVDAASLVRSGATTDIVILASQAIAALEAEGHIIAGSVIAFARSGMAIAVASGEPHPDISDEEALKHAILSARTVGYSTGPSGRHLLELCQKWGIDQQVKDRMIEAPPGVPVGRLVAEGVVQLGFQQLSELLGVAGTEIVGPLPGVTQAVTIFSAGISSKSAQPDVVRTFIAYLTAPEASEIKRKYGMEPA